MGALVSAGSAQGQQQQELSARQRFEYLHDTLRRRICLLDYPPNTRLREEELAAEFGVSRTPLRRVLGRLESEGLVKSVHGVGTIVTDVDIDELTQVYQLRMELAEMIGRLSPVSTPDIPVDRIRRLLTRSQQLSLQPDPRGFAELNMDFFHALMELSHNIPLRDISERLYYQTTRIWLKSIDHMDLEAEIRIFSQEISSILDALVIGDIEAAGYIRRSHISMSFKRLSVPVAPVLV
ncbi:MAG: GntR family transcriptional regulator [Thiolinea sp.]